jgi:hypothetical protein
MADLWDKVKKTVSEVYTTASGKAVDGVNLGVKKLDEVSIRRELSKEFAGLGGRAYQLLKRNEEGALATDATVRHHMSRLEELEKRLEEKEREIQDILKAEAGTDARPSEAAPPGASADAAPAEPTPEAEAPASPVGSPPAEETTADPPKGSDPPS